MTTSSTNNSVFRGFFEKQKLTGPNFIDWYRQLMIVLSIEDKLNYLEHPIPPVPVALAGQQVAPEILAAHTAWVKGSKEIAGLMLLTMEPEIQRNLEPLHAQEMLKELKTLFTQQVEQELLQTTRDFHSCRQEEGQSVQKSNKHKKSHSQKGAKGQNQGKEKFVPKPKIPPPPKRKNPAKDSIYHECGEIRHWKRNCPQCLFELMKNKKNTTSGAGVYGGDIKRELRISCYTNAGYLTDADDLKSRTGYVFILNGGAVDWKSAKQNIFATSSAEAEYIAAFDASNEAVWVRKFISGLSVVSTIEEPISMYYDNTGAIAIANESGITKGARHFRAKVHYLREVIEFGDIKLKKVHTYVSLADPFTKALAFPKHSEHTKNIGMLPASSLM
nr:zinc finger, CCHC-type [Tanacetum cinerariifolium]